MSLLVGAMALFADAQVAPTTANSRWILRADQARCSLERQNAESGVALSISTTPGSDEYRVAIVTSDRKKHASFVSASLTFSPSQHALNGHVSVAKMPDGKQIMWMDGVAPALLDEIAGADTVTITTKAGASGSASVGGTAKAIQAFRRCTADQLIEWGSDAKQFAPGGMAPIAVKRRDAWLSTKEVSAMMGQTRSFGIDAVFLLAVSPEGLIDGCRPIDDGLEKGVEKVACAALINKPLFTPARDAGGRPVRGVATFRILLASR